VQGIGFRYFARQQARDMGVSGWVRNLPEGGVEVEAEGSKEAVESFLSMLQTGHPYANVDEVARTELKPVGGPKAFEILQ
jgi:acylphosphatase